MLSTGSLPRKVNVGCELSLSTVNACVYGQDQDIALAHIAQCSKCQIALSLAIPSIDVSVNSLTVSDSFNSSITPYHDVSFIVSIIGLMIPDVLGIQAVAASLVQAVLS